MGEASPFTSHGSERPPSPQEVVQRGPGLESFPPEYLRDLKQAQAKLGRIDPTGCPEVSTRASQELLVNRQFFLAPVILINSAVEKKSFSADPGDGSDDFSLGMSRQFVASRR